MATLLDVGLLHFFNPLFAFLLVFVLAYAILIKTQPFGDEKVAIYAWISVLLALLTLAGPGLVDFVGLAAPYFTVMAIVFFLFVFLFLAMGVKGGTLTEYVQGDKVILWGAFVAGVLLLIFIFSQVFGPAVAPDTNEENPTELNTKIKDIIFHPTLMGVVFVLVLMAFAVRLLTFAE
jgi:Ca2+/Na+ antiporter